jgi:NAD(P)-dependent dehydrogenase (short-subunit alcohol dehydrogenase family)
MAAITAQSSRGVALVTGAGNRIGAVMARRLAHEGFAVVVHYRASAEPAKAVVADIKSFGGQAIAIQADLANRRARAGLIAKAAKSFGPLTVLVNNASTYEPDSATDLDEKLWDAHFAVHAEAPVFLARDFAAQLPAGAEGNIVNIIDERVLHLSPAYLSYTLSKSTLWTATQTLAQSLAPRIRVNAIGPGPTLAPPGKTEPGFKAAVAKLPLQRGASPGEIADGLMFILSARSMTGQMLALDGGQHLDYNERRKPTPRR